MEFIALLLLAPLIWSSSTSAPSPMTVNETVVVVATAPMVGEVQDGRSAARLEEGQGRSIVRPPEDSSLSMTVLEYLPSPGVRGPASVGARRIDVIVSAP